MGLSSIKFSQTGFIIGAGAHVPYGMPVSAQLTEKIKKLNHPKKVMGSFQPYSGDDEYVIAKKHICKIIDSQNLIKRHLHTSSANAYEIEVGKQLDIFLDTFAGSQVYSIDAFLAKYIVDHKKTEDDLLIKIGKIVLVYFIHKYETSIPTGYHQFDWIQHLINNLIKNSAAKEHFFLSPPKFSTFNYDRILERSLLSHLINFHGLKSKEAIEKVKSLNIKHFYGDLGQFEDEFDIDNPGHVKKALERIRVIGEERLKSIEQESQDFFEKYKNLKTVYILGYGFDEQNNELLFSKFKSKIGERERLTLQITGFKPTDSSSNYPNFYSTNIGLTVEACREIHQSLNHVHIDLGDYDKALGKINSLELLKVKHPYQQAIKEQTPENTFSTAEESYFGSDDYDY
jgi:hypothetical protein